MADPAHGSGLKVVLKIGGAMKKMFKPSGSFDAYIEGSILITSITGSWNLEMHRKSTLQSAPFVMQLEQAGQPWAVIVQIYETLLSSPEVLMAGRRSVTEMIQHTNLTALAWVANEDVVGFPLLIPRYREVYTDVLDSEFFTDLAQAKAWINHKLATD